MKQVKKAVLIRVSVGAIATFVMATAVWSGLFHDRSFEARAAVTTTVTSLASVNASTTETPIVPVTTPTTTKPAPITTTTTAPVVKKPVVKPVVKAPVKPIITPVKFRRNLSVGSRGDDVMYLERKLTEQGYLPGSIKGRFTSHTRHAVIAFQKVNGLKRDGVVRWATYDLLSKAKAPALRYPSGNHVEINKKLQVLIIVRNGKVKYITSTSTGSSKHTTPSVSSAVDWKSGPRYVSKKYNGIMVWPSFFYGGVAVHGYASVPVYPASHGCSRVPIDDAKLIYNNMPRGSMVYVY